MPSGFREPGLRRLSTETYVESECSVVVSSGDRCTRNKTTAVSRNNNTAVGGYGRKTRTFIHAQTTVTRHTTSTETFGSARLREKLGNTRRGGGGWARNTRGHRFSIRSRREEFRPTPGLCTVYLERYFDGIRPGTVPAAVPFAPLQHAHDRMDPTVVAVRAGRLPGGRFQRRRRDRERAQQQRSERE